MSASIVPDGQAPPFGIVTPTDHSAWIIIGTAFGLSCVLLFSVIRMWVRTSNAPRFALDDAFLGSATVSLPGTSCVLELYVANNHPRQLISIANSSITFYAASLGLGRSKEFVNPEDLVKIQKVRQRPISLGSVYKSD